MLQQELEKKEQRIRELMAKNQTKASTNKDFAKEMAAKDSRIQALEAEVTRLKETSARANADLQRAVQAKEQADVAYKRQKA